VSNSLKNEYHHSELDHEISDIIDTYIYIYSRCVQICTKQSCTMSSILTLFQDSNLAIDFKKILQY